MLLTLCALVVADISLVLLFSITDDGKKCIDSMVGPHYVLISRQDAGYNKYRYNPCNCTSLQQQRQHRH